VSVVLGIQHATRMCCIIFSHVAGPAVQYYILPCGRSGCTVLYSPMWPVRLYSIFPHYLIKSRIFGKKNLLNIQCVFWFFLRSLFQMFFIPRNIQRDIIIKVYWTARKVVTGYFCRILRKVEFSRQIFKKFSNIKFHENPFSGSRLVPWGQTDTHT